MVLQVQDRSFLFGLFEKAEAQKVSLNIQDIEEHKKSICENFALSVFSNADDEDRAGNSSMETAKAFYASSIFFDVLEQFDPELSFDLAEKRKYAKWRSAEIIRANKEGRAPAPPSPVNCDLLILRSIILCPDCRCSIVYSRSIHFSAYVNNRFSSNRIQIRLSFQI